MTVSFKAPVKSAVVNNAFVSKQADDVKVGKLGLNKASEGNQVFSVQKSVNELFDVTGTGEGDPNAKNYNNNNYIADGDSHKTAIEKLDAQVKNNADTIGDHINEALDAHDASAVSYDNTDSGLAAINAQDAIDEVESRLDTAETNISNHINNATDAHDASAISYVNTASGLVAINAQAAIDEVESRLGTAETDIQAIEDSIGQANGIAPLNGSSKIDATYLPSYVDDVLEYADIASLPLVGEQGKIYVTLDTNKTYRWTGSVYVEISASPVTSVNSQTGVVVLDADDIAETATRYWSKKNNVANSMPLVTNDSSQNYSVGSQWYDAINDTLYICEDATIGAAVWQPISGAGGGVGSVDIMFADTFENTDIADYTITQPLASISAVSPLQGENSLLIAHDFNPDYYIERIIPVDNKFKNKNVTFTLDVFTNAASGDLTLSVWDHTNTVQLLNSELIQPQDVDQTSAKRSFSFNIPSGANELRYRINVLFDSGKVSRVDNLVIELTQMSKIDTTIETPIITEWQSYVPSFQGFGVPTSVEMQWRQNGENVEIRGKFTTGTVTAVEARLGLPNGYISADSASIPSIQIIGKASRGAASTINDISVLAQPAINYVTFSVMNNTSFNGLSSRLGTELISSLDPLSVFASLPIQGLTATETQSVSLAQTVLVQESDSVLNARGNAGQVITVDVTNIPFNLVSNNGSDIIFNGNSFQVATDNIYDISLGVCFAGGDASREIWFYVDGLPNLQLCNRITTFNFHVAVNLKLEVGKVYSFRSRVNGGTLQVENNRHYLNITKQGSLKQLNVSENQKIEIPTSELRMEGASSRGSTATAIVRFDNIAKLRGDAFTVESDATLGTRITMKKKGRLNISSCIRMNSAASSYITKNQTVLTSFLPTSPSEILSGNGSSAGANVANPCWLGDVEIGDVIRITAEAVPASAANNSLNLSFQEQEVAVSVTNVLPQFSESDSSVRVDTANGYGSTANKIRRFSNVRDNLGSAITYVDSATNGASFTVNESGIYNVSYTDTFTGDTTVAISKNSANLTTNASALANNPNNELLAMSRSGSVVFANVSWQGYLQKDDVIRAHTDGQVAGDNDNVKFTISKVGKPNVTGVDVTPFAKIEYEVKQFIESLTATTTFGGTRTGVPVLNITKNTNNGLIRVDSSAANGTEFVALKRCEVYMSANATGDNASVFITKNSTIFTLAEPDGILARSGINGFTNRLHCSATVELIAGDILRVQRNTNTVTPIDDVLIVATELRDAYQVIGGGVENTYSARINNNGTATIASQSYPFIQNVVRNSVGNVTVNFIAGFFTAAPIVTAQYINAGAGAGDRSAFIVGLPTVNSVTIGTEFNGTTLTDVDFNIIVQRQGSDYRTPSKAIGLPAQRVAVLKDVKAANTAGGASTTTFSTRTLNTIEDPTGVIVNFSSNQFTLNAGTYLIKASAPAYRTNHHIAKIRNITDSSDVLIGTAEYSANAVDGAQSRSFISGVFTINSTKTFEVQHIAASVFAAGFGVQPNLGVSNVFTVVELEKIEE